MAKVTVSNGVELSGLPADTSSTNPMPVSPCIGSHVGEGPLEQNNGGLRSDTNTAVDMMLGTAPQESRLSSSSQQQEVTAIIRNINKVNGHPKGLPQLAAVMSAGSNLLMYRRFRWLRNRLLMKRQLEIMQLERNLVLMDDEIAKTNGDALRTANTELLQDVGCSRDYEVLMDNIHEKLGAYDDLVSRMKNFMFLEGPSGPDYQNFQNWMGRNEPLLPKERSFLNEGHDLVALADTQESSWLDSVIEQALERILPRNSIFNSEQQKLQSDDESVLIRSGHRTEILIRLVLTIIIVLLLLTPTSVLFFVKGHSGLKIGLISGFTLLFAGILHVSTKAQRHENFAATAAYCAVLVVFLSNIAGPS